MRLLIVRHGDPDYSIEMKDYRNQMQRVIMTM